MFYLFKYPIELFSCPLLGSDTKLQKRAATSLIFGQTTAQRIIR